MKVQEIRSNFQYPTILPGHFRFGSGQLVGTPLVPTGDWRTFLPPTEDQNIRGIESSACYIEAQQHAIATIEDEQFDEIGNNYASRFNALLSDGTSQGGDPLKGADSMRHDGLVADASMPFGDAVLSWTDFHSWKGVNEQTVRVEGKNYLSKKELNFDIVFERDEDVSAKYRKARQALQYSPLPVSVTAWYERDDGTYYKPQGSNDNHLVELVFIDENNCPYIRDTYSPYLKKLEPFFNFDFGMRWSVQKKSVTQEPTPDQITLIQKFIAWLSQYVSFMQVPVPPVVVPPTPTPLPQSLLTKFCLAIKEFEGWSASPPSRSFRNNNPGNCRFSSVGYVSMYGHVGRDKDNFAIFKDYPTGFLYLKNLVLSKVRKNPEQTILQFFKVYAPASDNNDPVKYANYVAKRLGVGADYKMKLIV